MNNISNNSNNAAAESTKNYIRETIYNYFCHRLDQYDSIFDAASDANDAVNEIYKTFIRSDKNLEDIITEWMKEQTNKNERKN